MTTEADLSAKLDKIAADAAAAVTATQAALTDLKTQIATLQAGQPVSQTQLDDLSAKADAIDASLQPLLPAPSGT